VKSAEVAQPAASEMSGMKMPAMASEEDDTLDYFSKLAEEE